MNHVRKSIAMTVTAAIAMTAALGIQLDGYFPDTSTFNMTHGWNHDAQFVSACHTIGTAVVVAGPPGTRRQYASDVIISDTVLAQGYGNRSGRGPLFS